MVDIAQLVSASDCGSEGRGFESHYPPHKITPPLARRGYFMARFGIRKPGPGEAGVRNSPVDCFLGRGRIPALSDASGTDVDESANHALPATPKSRRQVPFLVWYILRLEAPNMLLTQI